MCYWEFYYSFNTNTSLRTLPFTDDNASTQNLEAAASAASCLPRDSVEPFFLECLYQPLSEANMPHKHKKSSAQKNGSPKAEKKQLLPEPAPEGSNVLASTNYKEIHENEADALRSIYADDFEDVEARPSAWQVSRRNVYMSLLCFLYSLFHN